LWALSGSKAWLLNENNYKFTDEINGFVVGDTVLEKKRNDDS